MKNEKFDFEKMPGHWVLAKLGKKVLRPGGLELTSHMLHTLKISDKDTVVEFAPGMGVTAKMTLENKPYEYIGVEQNEQAASLVGSYLTDSRRTCIVGDAQNTGLDDATASIVYVEAMLTMQSAKQKQQIIAEAKRILRPGGQYAIHEMCLAPDTLDDATKEAVQKDLSKSLRVNVRPLTISEWTQHLEAEGFVIKEVKSLLCCCFTQSA